AAVRRVQEANLLGILGFTLSMQSSGNDASVDGAVSSFRRAIGIDPGNDDALFNLEYALDQQKADQSGGGRNPRSTKGSRAGTQPTLVRRSQHHVRKDAQAWFVLDTSLSMKAAAGPAAPTRFERAQALAIRLRRKLGDVPVGIASITDRALPHLFPTADLN